MDISVAICTYNGEEYLEDQLDSILQQERPPDELVICDDGSKDGTPDILKEYQSRHPDLVEVYFNEETKGIVRNFSECIERCSGDVVALSDQDDVWHSNKLQRQVTAFEEHDVALVCHNSRTVTEDLEPVGDLWSSLDPPYEPGRLRDPEEGVRELVHRNVVQGATVLFSAELAERCTPIPDDVPHDYYVAFLAAVTSGIFDVEESLLDYRQHEAQEIGAAEVTLRERVRDSVLRDAEEFEQAGATRQRFADVVESLPAADLSLPRDEILEAVTCSRRYFQERATIYSSEVGPLEKFRTILLLARDGLYEEFGSGVVSVGRDLVAAVVS